MKTIHFTTSLHKRYKFVYKNGQLTNNKNVTLRYENTILSPINK